MKTKTHIKTGGWRMNHNAAQTTERTRGLKIKSGVKAGPGWGCPIWRCGYNHNETQVRAAR